MQRLLATKIRLAVLVPAALLIAQIVGGRIPP